MVKLIPFSISKTSLSMLSKRMFSSNHSRLQSKAMPLSGVKVVEFAGLAPGPFCGKILADWGASVVRIDKPNSPDMDKLSAGKRSIIVNSKVPEGVQLLHTICNKSDVLIDPYRPGVLERLNLGPDELRSSNPGLIYVRLTGYGQTGPLRSVAGHDINYCAMSGVLSLLGRKESPPTPPINLLADFGGGGLMAAYGVAMALLHKAKTGEGQVVDCSMTEGAAYLSSFLFATNNFSPIFGEGRGENWLDSGSHFYDTYKTSDGRYMAVGAVEPKFYKELIQKLGLDVEEIDQFSDWDENREKIRSKFLEKSFSHWSEVFSGSDACVTPVLSIAEAAASDLHRERDFMAPSHEDPSVVLPKPTPILSESPAEGRFVNHGLPVMGQHTKEVLKEIGCDENLISKLLDEGVVVDNSVQLHPKSKL